MATFEQICEENYERIYRYALGMTENYETARDITQEVFAIAYQKRAIFLLRENPQAFLYKTAKNLIMENFRRERREYPAEISESSCGYSDDSFEEICKYAENKVSVIEYRAQIISDLSDEKRKLYKWYYEDHKSMKDIAKELKINEFALRMRYVRLRKEIKEAVKKLKLGDF